MFHDLLEIIESLSEAGNLSITTMNRDSDGRVEDWLVEFSTGDSYKGLRIELRAQHEKLADAIREVNTAARNLSLV